MNASLLTRTPFRLGDLAARFVDGSTEELTFEQRVFAPFRRANRRLSSRVVIEERFPDD